MARSVIEARAHKLAALIVKLNRADNSALYAPPSTVRLERIGRDSPKSAALIHGATGALCQAPRNAVPVITLRGDSEPLRDARRVHGSGGFHGE